MKTLLPLCFRLRGRPRRRSSRIILAVAPGVLVGRTWPAVLGLWLLMTVADVSAGPPQIPSDSRLAPERSLFHYFQRRLAEMPPRFQLPDDPRDIRAWRDRLAARLPELLRLESSSPAPLSPRLFGTQERDGYRLEHIGFMSEPGVEVPAYVLIPHGASAARPVPAVLCLQGVVPGGKDELAGEVEGNPAAAAGLGRFHDDFARQLARAGFVTLAIDMRFDGERTYHSARDPFGLNDRVPAMVLANRYATMLGQTFFGLHLFDARRAIDYLTTRCEVRADILGCAGFSFGSTLGAWLAAIDRRIKVAAFEGNWASWRRLALQSLEDGARLQNGKPMHWMVSATYQAIPGFLAEMDLPLTVAAVAPTPMLLAYESDLSWAYADRAEAEEDVAPIRRSYAAFHASDKLHVAHVAGGHYWRPDVILPWFTARLRGLASATP
jgi:dienelactone hydrolase